jgi:hypothetical protein
VKEGLNIGFEESANAPGIQNFPPLVVDMGEIAIPRTTIPEYIL